MKINQIITENYNGEYDDEAGMAQTNLHTIARAAKGLLDTIDDKENLPEWVQEKIAKVEGMMVTAWDYLLSQEEQGMDPRMMEAANAAQQAAIAISMKKAHKKPKNESAELEEEFDLIESIIEHLAQHNGVDAEVIWEDLETLTEDELYAFAVTSEPIMESQGMSEGSEPDAYGRTGEKHECGSCDGTGIDTHDDECSECGGKGWIRDKQGVAEGVLDEAVGMIIKGAAISGPDDQDIADRIAARTGGRVDSGSRGHHILIIYPTTQHRAMAAAKIRKMFPGIELFKSGGNRNAIDEQGIAEDWQKANKRDKTDGMSQKAVNAYRRENPGSKLKTAVTTKPGKLKKGGKASKRRKSYCSRSRGQMKMHSISCAKTPDKAICKARRRWNC